MDTDSSSTTSPKSSNPCATPTTPTAIKAFTLGSDISTATATAFLDLLRADENPVSARRATKEELEEVLRFAIEGRKRVRDQIIRIDTTMAAVNFGYGQGRRVAPRHNAGRRRVPDLLQPVTTS